MNILSEEQAATRQLQLPREGVLDGLTAEFIAELQAAGSFIEYNQQVVIAAGGVTDYVSCIVAGRMRISRTDPDYSKAEISKLSAGEWFGETNLFVRLPARVEVYADGEVVIWTIPVETLRNLFFRDQQGTQLLYNFGRLLAEKIGRR